MNVSVESDAPIVMVDDNEDEIFIAGSCFDQSRLQNPFIALTSGEALISYLERALRKEVSMPQLVLLDISMPGLTGFETLAAIRKRAEFDELPMILMLTNSDNPADAQRSQELRASGFQRKPSGIDEYIAFFNNLV